MALDSSSVSVKNIAPYVSDGNFLKPSLFLNSAKNLAMLLYLHEHEDKCLHRSK